MNGLAFSIFIPRYGSTVHELIGSPHKTLQCKVSYGNILKLRWTFATTTVLLCPFATWQSNPIPQPRSPAIEDGDLFCHLWYPDKEDTGKFGWLSTTRARSFYYIRFRPSSKGRRLVSMEFLLCKSQEHEYLGQNELNYVVERFSSCHY